ncbi:MAG: hypothetical protein K6F51_09540 [Acetatifactor sp.]|nr:hypothetical protein [Acetatifactor sp.]
MKAKKLLIPATAVLLSLCVTACGPGKKDGSEGSGSPESKTESGNSISDGNGQKDDPQKDSSGSNVNSSSDYKYKVAADDPKNLTVELLNKDAIRCSTKNPQSKMALTSLSQKAEEFKEHQAKFPALDLSFTYDNFEEDWEYDLKSGRFAAIFVRKKGDDFNPETRDIRETTRVKTDGTTSDVITPIITDKAYCEIQSYLDANGAGEYEIRIYVRDPNADSVTTFHLHSVIPFTVKEAD